jgi:hypothetical protein
MEKTLNSSKIETECIGLLTANIGKKYTELEIYNHLHSIYNFRNPNLNKQLSFYVMVNLKTLETEFDHVYSTIENNKKLYYFSPNGIITSNNDNNNETKESDTLNKNELNNKTTNILLNKYDLPDKHAIANFIVDENLCDYIPRNDINGNNICHDLIMFNEFERLNKILQTYYYLIYEENNDKLTPIDLITDIKISNMFIKNLLKNNKNIEYKMNEYKNCMDLNFNILENKINKIFDIMIVFLFIFLFILIFMYFSK